ncbi:MAG TPA: hypothetical protein VFV99_13960 [Kofleriaceae bacterium]|nr:hypothetical protein [Kofleriaceae bacterium]
MLLRTSIAMLMLVCATAHAEVKVDWARGLVTADAVGVADRHAPNPAVARGTSRRGAEDAAKKLLAAKVGELPVAGGSTVAAKAKDKAVKERIERAVANAITLAADPETDGAWKVTLAVPIEAVRQAIAGPRALPADGDKGPVVVVVDSATAKPAVGWTIAGVEAPVLWVTDVPAWAKDAPHATAKGAKGGAIEVTGIDASAATLFVVVTK